MKVETKNEALLFLREQQKLVEERLRAKCKKQKNLLRAINHNRCNWWRFHFYLPILVFREERLTKEIVRLMGIARRQKKGMRELKMGKPEVAITILDEVLAKIPVVVKFDPSSESQGCRNPFFYRLQGLRDRLAS